MGYGRIIDEGWSTALILEDDADWDINIKGQLRMFANISRVLTNARYDPISSPTSNPYGLEWDILWLGPCATPQDPEDAHFFPGENGSQQHWVWKAKGGMGK